MNEHPNSALGLKDDNNNIRYQAVVNNVKQFFGQEVGMNLSKHTHLSASLQYFNRIPLNTYPNPKTKLLMCVPNNHSVCVFQLIQY